MVSFKSVNVFGLAFKGTSSPDASSVDEKSSSSTSSVGILNSP